jgi:hypothetical protein
MLLVYFFVTKAELPATNEATLRPCVYHISWKQRGEDALAKNLYT